MWGCGVAQHTVNLTKLVMLFMLMHQKMDNLRQCPSMLVAMLDLTLSSTRNKPKEVNSSPIAPPSVSWNPARTITARL